jgi:hypothetical protein
MQLWSNRKAKPIKKSNATQLEWSRESTSVQKLSNWIQVGFIITLQASRWSEVVESSTFTHPPIPFNGS